MNVKLAVKVLKNDHVTHVIDLSALGSIWNKSKKHLLSARSILMNLGFSQSEAESIIDSFVWRNFYD